MARLDVSAQRHVAEDLGHIASAFFDRVADGPYHIPYSNRLNADDASPPSQTGLHGLSRKWSVTGWQADESWSARQLAKQMTIAIRRGLGLADFAAGC